MTKLANNNNNIVASLVYFSFFLRKNLYKHNEQTLIQHDETYTTFIRQQNLLYLFL